MKDRELDLLDLSLESDFLFLLIILSVLITLALKKRTVINFNEIELKIESLEPRFKNVTPSKCWEIGQVMCMKQIFHDYIKLSEFLAV